MIKYYTSKVRKKLQYSYRINRLITNLIQNRCSVSHSYDYLNVGCGDAIYNNYLNIDKNWRPGVNLCWDLTKKALPIPGNSVNGIFTEHFIEHIALKEIDFVFRQLYKVLKNEGVLRVSTPDAELFLDLYRKSREGEKVHLPGANKYNLKFTIEEINRIFNNHGHQFIYDFPFLKFKLEKIGFRGVRKVAFQKGYDENILLDQGFRSKESMYVECFK